MITAVEPQKAIGTFSHRHTQPRLRSRKERRPERVLIAEHRDEVFARLAVDLREMGYTVFRASRADDVCRMYSYGQIELVLYNFTLPCESAWLSAMKLRMFDAYVRVWLYMPRKATFDQQWANLSRIERVIYYQGNLFHLAHQIRQNLLQITPRSCVTTVQHAGKRLWEASC